MTLSRRTFFAAPVVIAGLFAIHSPVFAAIKPKAISNRVPSGGSLRGPGYLDQANGNSTARASGTVRVGIALYAARAQIFSETGQGTIIDLLDLAVGNNYAAGQSIDIYQSGSSTSQRLVLKTERSVTALTIGIDWATGKLTQIEAPAGRAAGRPSQTVRDANLGNPQGRIALLPGGTNLWEIER